MIKIKIGTSDERVYGDHGIEQWIVEQIQRRRNDGNNVCVRVQIKHGDIDISLATPGCNLGGGGGMRLRPKEIELVELWRKMGLFDGNFTHGNLIAFLKQIKSLA